jgi:hypothetical protein
VPVRVSKGGQQYGESTRLKRAVGMYAGWQLMTLGVV